MELLGLQYHIRKKEGDGECISGCSVMHRTKRDSLSHHFVLTGVAGGRRCQLQLQPIGVTLAGTTGGSPLSQGEIHIIEQSPPFRYRIWLGGSTTLKHRIMAAFHDSPMVKHSGFPMMHRQIHRLFVWPKMK